mmetsp:Transcript_16772/g.39458  ORF Transcript_16772/g.39458 Transcript_16772/m.39458 type:complete len:139 (-) Transcript_16772:47-463(-)
MAAAFECSHCSKTFATEQRAHLHLRYIHQANSNDYKRLAAAEETHEKPRSSFWLCSCFEGFGHRRSDAPAPAAEGSDEHPAARQGQAQRKVKIEYESKEDDNRPLVDPENCLCKKQPCVCTPCMCGRSTVCVCNGTDF